MTLAAGGEVGSLFHNSKADEIIRVTLEEMGHPQYANPMHTDNSTAEHRWELPGNYPVFTVVMVIYHYVERIWRILVTTILLYNIYDH